MVPPKVVPSSQIAALYFIVNWAGDQTNYIAAMMVSMVAMVVMGVATKVTAIEMAK